MTEIRATTKSRKKSQPHSGAISSFFRINSNPFKRLHMGALPTYLALRRQKVKVGALKQAVEDRDLEIFVCMPELLEEQIN